MIDFLVDKYSINKKDGDFDFKTYLNSDINTKIDRSSMSASLEARSPLLDYRIIEFAHNLPLKYKFSMSNQKTILKDLLSKYLPRNLFERPKKGFSVPLENWFRKELKNYVLENLSYNNLKNIPCIDINLVKKNIDDHMSQKSNNAPQIWRLIVLKEWISNNGKGYKFL